MSEDIKLKLESYQSRLAAIKSQYDEQIQQLQVSKTAKTLARKGGAAITDLLGIGKQIGSSAASDFVSSSRKQQIEKVEVQTLRNIEHLVSELRNYLSGISIHYKTNPSKNSEKLAQRLNSIEGKTTCKGKINHLARILASLQSKTLIPNTELEKKVKVKRTEVSVRHIEPHIFDFPLARLLQTKENEFVEFKTTLRWDVVERRINKNLEQAVAKTIAGFMNSEGGVLLIGVDDDGVICGLGEDLSTLSKKNHDGFQLHLRQIIESRLGKVNEAFVKIRFEEQKGKDACLIYVSPSDSPVFLRSNRGEKLFPVRLGNSTKSLDVEETTSYIRKRWPM
jgi:hypothetical protein